MFLIFTLFSFYNENIPSTVPSWWIAPLHDHHDLNPLCVCFCVHVLYTQHKWTMYTIYDKMNIGLLLEEHAVLSRERGTRCRGVQHVSGHEADTPNICSRWLMFIIYLSSAFYIYFFVYSNMNIRLLKYAYAFLTHHSIYFYKLYLRAPRKFSYD